MLDDRLKTGRIALCIAAALYAFFSSPSPDEPGVIEALIILLLMGAAFCGGLKLDAPWAKPLLLLLVYGASVPLFIGALSGAAPGDMVRDVVAFGALGLPLLLYGLFVRDARLLLLILLTIGFAFALRYLLMPDIVLVSLASGPFDDRLLYLANSPLVFFAAAWLLLHGSFREEQVRRAVFFIILSLVPIAAMIGMMQRATLGLLACAWVAGLIVTFIYRPHRAFVLSAAAATGLIMMGSFLGAVVQGLIFKTETVGLNARVEEWRAVFEQINQSPVSVLFGRGWGSLMQSPAVGDEWVRFSHSLLSSMLWKTGWIGLGLSVLAIGVLAVQAVKRLKTDIVTASALLLALIPSCLLYGSYKSLCFGLLLTGLVCLVLTRPDQNV